MLVADRRRRVLEIVSQKGFIALADLAREMQVSESTIRRDLDELDRDGTVRRTHGGAVYVGDEAVQPALSDRATRQRQEKRAIAKAALARLNGGDTVLLDGGTTTLEVARLLMGRSLQIVTNSLPIANLLTASSRTDVILLGGYLYPRTGVLLGPLTVKTLTDIHVNQALMSCGGITDRGLFNKNLLLVETQRQMMRCADEVVVLADHTKIGRPALSFLCDFTEVDTLIVDKGVTPSQRELLTSVEARLIVAGEKQEFES